MARSAFFPLDSSSLCESACPICTCSHFSVAVFLSLHSTLLELLVFSFNSRFQYFTPPRLLSIVLSCFFPATSPAGSVSTLPFSSSPSHTYLIQEIVLFPCLLHGFAVFGSFHRRCANVLRGVVEQQRNKVLMNRFLFEMPLVEPRKLHVGIKTACRRRAVTHLYLLLKTVSTVRPLFINSS